MFKDVDLHISFPNLTLLNMKVEGYQSDPFLLPDLSGCEGLESITVEPLVSRGHMPTYSFRLYVSFQSNLKEKVTDMTLHGE